VALLPFQMELAGVAVQIMAVPPDVLRQPARGGGGRYPPALFVHMPRDERTAAYVAMDVAEIRAQGGEAEEWRAEPLPITPTFFSERIDEIDAGTSVEIFAALRGGGLIDGGGLLLEDPRGSEWREVVTRAVPAARGMPLRADESHIAEVLNVAWASHEIISDFTDATLDWWEARRPPRAAGLGGAHRRDSRLGGERLPRRELVSMRTGIQDQRQLVYDRVAPGAVRLTGVGATDRGRGAGGLGSGRLRAGGPLTVREPHYERWLHARPRIVKGYNGRKRL